MDRAEKAAAKAERRGELARAKAARPWYRKPKFWVLGLVVLAVGGAAVGASGGGGNDGDSAEVAAQDALAIGETGRTADLEVTLHEVLDPFVPDNDFAASTAPGSRLIAVELTLANTSDDGQPFSTLLGVELTDVDGRKMSLSLGGAGELATLDGDVPAGERRRGFIVYSAPDSADEFRLRVKGSLTATGTVFAIP